MDRSFISYIIEQIKTDTLYLIWILSEYTHGEHATHIKRVIRRIVLLMDIRNNYQEA